jgi:hypothetical protein
VNWKFLGLAMPAWVLICALALGAFGVFTNALVRSRQKSRLFARPAQGAETKALSEK